MAAGMAIVPRFEAQLDRAMKRVKLILETTRHPQFAGDVHHVYDDKFFLAEFLTTGAIAAQTNVLDLLGLTGEQRQQVQAWQQAGQSVSLRLRGEQTCQLLRQADRKVDSAESTRTETRVLGFAAVSSSSKIVTTVHEWFWSFAAHYELVAYPASSVDAALVLRAGRGEIELTTNSERPPHPAAAKLPDVDVNVTWLVAQLAAADPLDFTVDRAAASCRTPRRNDQIDAAVRFFASLRSWYTQLRGTFTGAYFAQQNSSGLQMSAITADQLFVPVLPLFEDDRCDDETTSSSSSAAAPLPSVRVERAGSRILMSSGDLVRFLIDQRRGLEDKFAELERLFPRDNKLITAAEAQLCVLAEHGAAVAGAYLDSVDYIEGLLYKQLHAAIGKEIGPGDFAEYMRFHNRKLFRDEHEPRPFCYAVRRPEHYPEGVVSIEATTSALPEPILTCSRLVQPSFAMQFALDAATSVTFRGERYLHAWINYSFEGQSGVSLSLNARARQFSSFVLLVGRVLSASKFEPTGALVVHNKDDVSIPLLLEQIPTPKEFKDATASLSPEQRRFAKAYRDMQLASTMFGVCVLQIKPQLERLLNLPPDSLTKEIKLSQDILSLFVNYQIPSDLLTYSGPDDAPADVKLQVVSGYVDAMLAMIEQKKEEEAAERQRERDMQRAQADSWRAPPASPTLRNTYYFASAECEGGGIDFDNHGSASWGIDLEDECVDLMAFGDAAGGAMPECSDPFSAAPNPTTVATTSTDATQPSPAQPSQAQPDGEPSGGVHFDYTAVPQRLNKAFGRLDVDNALRPTTIKLGDGWTRKRQATLLSPVVTTTLSDAVKNDEKKQTFDLLDALSRSGSLPFDDASFHVVLASTHCFTKSVTDTVIQDNVNPIEKVERSALIVASTVQECAADQLVKPDQLDRLRQTAPLLF